LRDFHTPNLSLFYKSHPGILTPITEEHTKLLDCLSEPSSRLIHRISHPPKRMHWPKLELHVSLHLGFTVCQLCAYILATGLLSSQLLMKHAVPTLANASSSGGCEMRWMSLDEGSDRQSRSLVCSSVMGSKMPG